MQTQAHTHSQNSVRSDASFEHLDQTRLDAMLSALVDDELSHQDCDALMQHLSAGSARSTCMQSWQTYQVVGECLRAPGQSHAAADASAFLSKFRQRLDAENAPKVTGLQSAPEAILQPAPQIGPIVVNGGEAANASVFRWKMVAGFASLAAIAAIGWNSVATYGGASDMSGGQAVQLASSQSGANDVAMSVPEVTAPNALMAVANHRNAEAANVASSSNMMIRDPKLDELLARQYGNTVALQPPAAFLRNANLNNGSSPSQ